MKCKRVVVLKVELFIYVGRVNDVDEDRVFVDTRALNSREAV